ncbi:ACR3 family arsenite efflux transporter [Streptomyces sp. NPDC001828]|uniref:ACR3 family arsenite efflux transporter n=1 Tax=Streptomyces sp. NPDC001828 TaxID=3364615 RepID=UPI0036A9F796
MSAGTTPAPAVGRLSFVDRCLAVWILLAMAAGLGLGRAVPGLGDALAEVTVTGVSLPIALGLLVMMYPVLAKVRYDRLDTVTRDRRLLLPSLLLNWVLGPALMFALAWIFLPDLPEYRTGLIIVGLARCIAMVIIWNDLACGDREAAAVLVVLNCLFQVAAFSLLGWFYLSVLPGLLGLERTALDVSVPDIARSVLIFLGIPLVAGFLTRHFGEKAKGRTWYESQLLPRVGPFALYGLLFTIVVLFALQGDAITSRPLDVARIALPLLVYFAVMWAGSMALGRAVGLGYPRATALAFTAAGNNFELAIAVAIATFGATSGQALAGVVGPLIEVPVLIGLVHVALAARRYFPEAVLAGAGAGAGAGADAAAHARARTDADAHVRARTGADADARTDADPGAAAPAPGPAPGPGGESTEGPARV